MTRRLIIHEVKRNAGGRYTEEQSARYELWVRRSMPRLTPREPITVIGNDWECECEDEAHAQWLIDWLMRECGFSHRSMFRIKAAA